MVRVALIITAYDNLDFFEGLLKVYSKYFSCFVHFDKKTHLPHGYLSRINEMQNVLAIQKYKVNWGSYLHFIAMTDLLKMALEKGCDRFSIISANCLPIKNPQKIIAFFDENKERNFLSYIVYKDTGGGYDWPMFEKRWSAYYFQHIYNLKSKNKFVRKIAAFYEKIFVPIQQKLRLRKNHPQEIKYKGYVYCHLNKNAAQFALDYIANHTEYIKFLKYCWVGEEFFFQNILLNSKFKDTVVNDCLIYDIWKDGRGYPAFLDMRDFSGMTLSKKFFARKIKDEEVWNKIRKEEGF